MAKGKFSSPRQPRYEQPVAPLEQQTDSEQLNPDFMPSMNEEMPVSPRYDVPPVPRVPPAATNRSSHAFDDPDFRRYSSKNKKIILISVCSAALALVIAAIIGVLFFSGTLTDDGLILNNVTAAGINLGGMDRKEAEIALHQATDHTFTQQNMVVNLPDTTLEFSPADTGTSLNVEAVVEEAFRYGREGSREEREQIKANAMVSNHPIALLPYLNLKLDVIRSALEEYGSKFNSDFAPSSVQVLGEAPVLNTAKEAFSLEAPCQVLEIYLGKPGRYLDVEHVYNQILDAYSFNQFHLTVTLEQPETIPEAIDLVKLHEQYYSAPVDAVLDRDTFEVIPEVYGYGFDLPKAQTALDSSAYGDTVTIPLEYIAPPVRGSELSGILFRDVLGSFETKHTKDSNRNTNLKLACEAINNYVLEPGDVFDYNKVLGKRTAAKGYKPAGAYSSGLTVSEVGGGICQVSSTLYYTTLVADLEIVKRSPHSFVSSYMPMGMDASVSWGGPEFRFKNSTNYPIRIEAEVSDGKVKVRLLGTDEKDYYIKMEYEVINTVHPTTVTEEIPAENNPNGYRDGQVIATAYTGYTVKTYKCKYSKATDKLISRDYDTTSVYNKRDKTIASIIQPTEPPTEPSTEPSTQPPTEPSTEPPTEAPTVPSTDPAVTDPSVPPDTSPTTAPSDPPATTQPATDPTTAPPEPPAA